jgi:hypothetical protein
MHCKLIIKTQCHWSLLCFHLHMLKQTYKMHPLEWTSLRLFQGTTLRQKHRWLSRLFIISQWWWKSKTRKRLFQSVVYLAHMTGYILLANLSHATCLTQQGTYTWSVTGVISVPMKFKFSVVIWIPLHHVFVPRIYAKFRSCIISTYESFLMQVFQAQKKVCEKILQNRFYARQEGTLKLGWVKITKLTLDWRHL